MEKIEIIDDLQIILFNPGETLTKESIENYISTLNNHRNDTSEYIRFVDFSKINSANFSFSDFKDVALKVRDFKKGNSKARASFFCRDFGIEKLVNHFYCNIRPEINTYFASENLEECADHLGVDISILKTN